MFRRGARGSDALVADSTPAPWGDSPVRANDGGLEARGSNQTQTKRIRPEWSPPARTSGPLNGASDIDPKKNKQTKLGANIAKLEQT